MWRQRAQGQMRSRATILALVVAATVVALGFACLGPFTPVFHRPIPISPNGGVAEIDLVPIPEGPPGVPFQRTPTVEAFRPLAQIERFIPDPLPAPLFQGLCSSGGNMVVILGNGKQVTYGPCHRPASIDQLWAEMIYFEENAECAPRCGPGGTKGP